jgi:hypothetical protein
MMMIIRFLFLHANSTVIGANYRVNTIKQTKSKERQHTYEHATNTYVSSI